jgi:hypothetical protein
MKPVPDICGRCPGQWTVASEETLRGGKIVRNHRSTRVCFAKDGTEDEVPADCPFLTEIIVESGQTEPPDRKRRTFHMIGWDIATKCGNDWSASTIVNVKRKP